MVKRRSRDHYQTISDGSETLTTSITAGKATLKVGIERQENGEHVPFIALSNDEFNDALTPDPDLLITVPKDGPKLVVRGSVESFSIDLFALARKLAEDPSMAQAIGRASLKLGQAPPVPNAGD